MFLDTGEVFQKIVADFQHAYCTVIKFIAFGGNGCFLSRSDNQLRVKFFFERADMCADGWLGKIKFSGCFGKASVIDNGNKSF